MEVLSGVASGFAVVSLAVQLADKVKDVYDFWHSVREAPGSIRVICNDLKILSDVLLEIGRTHKEDGPTSITMNALAICTFLSSRVYTCRLIIPTRQRSCE